MIRNPFPEINPIKSRRLLLFFFVGLCFFLCYNSLQFGVKSWDEAVYANNAIEMSKNGNWWVLYNNSQPDFYNTKPPFVIWLQSIFISVFGLSELAIRLPSFISLFCIVIVLFRFLQKIINSQVFHFFTLSILLSSYGFIGFHGFATGDLDAMLCLWITLYSLIILDKILLADKKPNPKWIYLSGLFFFLAFLTKSTAAFLPVPGLVIAVFIFKKQKTLFQNKHFYIVLSTIFLLLLGYYNMMEIKRPGYFSTAWNSEYKRIYSNIMPWHTQSFLYYLENLNTRFFPWLWLLIPSIILGIRSETSTIKKLTVFSSVYSACYFLIISIPSVKLEWYDIPVYPFLAILSSVIFYEIVTWPKVSFGIKNITFAPVFLLLFTGIFIISLISAVKKMKYSFYKEPLEREGLALRQLIKKPPIKNLKVLMYAEHPEHYNQVNFYREKIFKLPEL